MPEPATSPAENETPLSVPSTNAGIGVAFSSGFFGFFAHAGFLAAARQLGINPIAYAGSSSGAIVAAMAASGMTDAAIRETLFRVKKADFWDPDPWHEIARSAVGLLKGYSGYLRGAGFSRLLHAIPTRSIEACPTPLAISATNLTLKKETIFMRGDLIKAVQASGSVPMLFKPVEIDGALYVDGGITSKAPVRAVSGLAPLKRIIVHFIASKNVDGDAGLLSRPFTPGHIQYLAVNIARQEAYRQQLELVRMKGIEVIEVKTEAVPVGPNRLHRGPAACAAARESALEFLSERGFPM